MATLWKSTEARAEEYAPAPLDPLSKAVAPLQGNSNSGPSTAGPAYVHSPYRMCR